jgi:hypothetical protein
VYNEYILKNKHREGMNKMNLFEKLGLVERDEAINRMASLPVEEVITSVPTEAVIDISKVNVDTLITEVYAQNNLSDMTKSIFKVKELSDTLPTEMRTDIKKTTVLGILKVSGLNVDEIISDGMSRIVILDNAKIQIVSECDTKISDANIEIERLKGEIEELQKISALTEAEKNQSVQLIDSETLVIEALYKFINTETK